MSACTEWTRIGHTAVRPLTNLRDAGTKPSTPSAQQHPRSDEITIECDEEVRTQNNPRPRAGVSGHFRLVEVRVQQARAPRARQSDGTDPVIGGMQVLAEKMNYLQAGLAMIAQETE